MAQNITIAGASFTDVPSIVVPKTSSGTATFVDTTDATASASDIDNGKTAYVNGSLISGTSTASADYASAETALGSSGTPLDDSINALTTYANGITGASDTTLSDAVGTLASGYGGGGSGYEFAWATTSQVVTIGSNSISNTSAVKTYFADYSYDKVILLSELTTNNQFVGFGASNGSSPTRWRGGAIAQTTVGTAYDARLVEGTKYLLLKY